MPRPEEAKFKPIVEGADALSLGISMVVAVVIGVFIGIGLQNLFGVTWVLWIGVFIGIGAAGLNIYKIYQKQKKELDKLKDDPRYKNYAQQKDDDEDDY